MSKNCCTDKNTACGDNHLDDAANYGVNARQARYSM
jgi:hypothetical protein